MSESLQPYNLGKELATLLPGWTVREYGVCLLEGTRGYENCRVSFKYGHVLGGINQSSSGAQLDLGKLSLLPKLAFRPTPDSVRQSILTRNIQLPDQRGIRLADLWCNLFADQKTHQVDPTVTDLFRSGNLPMLDVSIFFPYVDGETLAFYGLCDNPKRIGVAAIIPGDKLSVAWVNKEQKNLYSIDGSTPDTGPLTITPKLADRDEQGVFTIVGRHKQRPDAQTATNESITALFAYSEAPKPRPQLNAGLGWNSLFDKSPSIDEILNGGSKSGGFFTGEGMLKGGGNTRQGPSLARRGSDQGTGIKVEAGQADRTLIRQLLLNIMPIVIPPQLDAPTRENITALSNPR